MFKLILENLSRKWLLELQQEMLEQIDDIENLAVSKINDNECEMKFELKLSPGHKLNVRFVDDGRLVWINLRDEIPNHRRLCSANIPSTIVSKLKVMIDAFRNENW